MFKLRSASSELTAALTEASAFAEWFRGKAGGEAAFAELLISRTFKTIQRDRRHLRIAMFERGWSARDYVIWTASREAHALILELNRCSASSGQALRRLFEICSIELLRSGFLTRKDMDEDRASLDEEGRQSANFSA